MSRAKIAHLPSRTIIEIAGGDARPFLQGIISNDINQLGKAKPIYAAMLTPQGKFLADFIMVDRGDAIWLDTASDTAATLLQRLTMYRLRADVVLTQRDDLSVVAAFGGVPPELPQWVGITDPRLAALGRRLIGQSGELGAIELDATEEAYERHRLELGVPVAGRDIVAQKSILLECNFEELHGVSFDKGCFVGQELTARTKHRGLIKKRLLPVAIDGPEPQGGSIILAGEREAGELRSVNKDIGIALLRLERIWEPLHTGESKIAPRPVPWLELPPRPEE